MSKLSATHKRLFFSRDGEHSIALLDLDIRIHNILIRNGYRCIEDVINGLDITLIPGLIRGYGKKSHQVIKDALVSKGFSPYGGITLLELDKLDELTQLPNMQLLWRQSNTKLFAPPDQDAKDYQFP